MADVRSFSSGAEAGQTLRSIADLTAAGLVPPESAADLSEIEARYAIAISPQMQRLIDPSDPVDPIGMQFLPDLRERVATSAELVDPIGDGNHMPVPGLVHRYTDRVLLKITHACAVYCRFCFRREMVGPGKEAPMSPDALEAALEYISAHPQIWEVILTGGDPLVLSVRRIAELMQRLSRIEHVGVIRLHTRIPAVDPHRITPEVVKALSGIPQTVYMALHVNHARELSPEAVEACRKLSDAGVVMISQTVLLRGLNDNAEVLADLMRAFVKARIKPYYLHHPDLAPGTGHWRLTLAEGMRIVADLRRRVSGLCQPAYVLDIPGGYGKVPVDSDHVRSKADGTIEVCDPNGIWHDYPQD